MGRNRLILAGFLLLARQGSATINCYSCTSRDGSDPNCEDPMSPAHTEYTKNCMVPKENHVGRFPANFCVKLAGTNADTGETIVTRTCVLEDMNSQCGLFKFENATMNGCILTCDSDGCNTASNIRQMAIWQIGAALTFLRQRV